MTRLLPRTLMAPAVIALVLWMLAPLLMSIYFSFVNYNLMQPGERTFNGLANFSYFVTDPDFWPAVWNTLVLIGSVRHSEDATRVYDLRIQAREMGVNEQVLFVTDAPWKDVQSWLGRAWVGVNTMWNEHFGIGVVEYQAAGLISVVHNSGGPKEDIVVEIDGGRTGMLYPSNCFTASS